jgi:hypothetical protein
MSASLEQIASELVSHQLLDESEWNAPDFCTRGYESMGWVNETAVCC